MSEISFEQMLEEEGSLNQIRTGAVVTGTVIGVKDNEINLNIGYKADGVITKSEYTNDANLDLKEAVKVGDEMRVKVLKVNDGDGQVLLSYKRLAQDRALEELNEACESGEVLSGTVSNATTGGLSVMKDGVRIFIPASLVGENYVKDLTKFVGQEIEFKLIECNPRKRRVIGDRKSVLKARREEAEKALFDTIQEGMIVTGTVKNLTDFGAFIDIGGADGLLHISEMSWGRLEHPKKVFKVGQEVECFIKSIKGKKIGLSMKFPDQDPWLNAEEKYAIGNIVTGKVARMTAFGAFVELAPGVDALLHVSQIGKDRVNEPGDVLQLGQEIEAKVVEFNGADKKISISIKALEMDRPTEEKATIEVPAEIAAAVSGNGTEAEEPVAEASGETAETEAEVKEAGEETPEA